MVKKMLSFRLRPDFNWPTEEEFEMIRRLERDRLIREMCPQQLYWEFQVLDSLAEEQLPAVCFRLAYWG